MNSNDDGLSIQVNEYVYIVPIVEILDYVMKNCLIVIMKIGAILIILRIVEN